MSTSAPEVIQPVTFPARLAWLQHQMRHHIRPYHVVVAGIAGLITAVFAVIVLVIVIVATNFNVLGWVE
jgi:uncharacterized membrane protein